MRFLIFNIAVAGALVYLVTGGNLPVNDLIDKVTGDPTVAAKPDKIDHIDADNEKIREAVSEAMAKMRAAAEFKPATPKPAIAAAQKVDAPKTVKQPKAGTEAKPAVPKADAVLAPVANARDVGRDPGHVIDPTKARPLAVRSDAPEVETAKVDKPAAKAGPAPNVSPDVAQRRAEVLAESGTRSAVPAKIQLEDGASLMTPAVRLKELQALSDELEFMYLERRGG